MPLIHWSNLNLHVPFYGGGGLSANGIAAIHVVRSIATEGGLTVSGEVSGQILYDTAVGGAVISGRAASTVSIFRLVSGGAVVSDTTVRPYVVAIKVAQGGARVGWSTGSFRIYYNTGIGEARLGGKSDTAKKRVNRVDDCKKGSLPNHPKPSTADYSSKNVAPLIEFFAPIVSSVVGKELGVCDIQFRYENNTPCDPTDDITVDHPTCVGVPYEDTPQTCVKSNKKQRDYVRAAKKSKRLREFAQANKITYFKKGCAIKGNY